MSHQVFEQSCKLFHQTGELDEGGPQVRAVPAHEVTPELVQSLSVILLILHMLCEEEKKKKTPMVQHCASILHHGVIEFLHLIGQEVIGSIATRAADANLRD